MNENAKTKLVLEYTGMDDFSCPVYKDQFGKLCSLTVNTIWATEIAVRLSYAIIAFKTILPV